MEKTKTVKMYELAIFYDNDNELIESYEYDTLEILTNELKDVLVHYKNYTKLEISLITIELNEDGDAMDTIDCEPIFTITNERKNTEE